MPGFTDDSGHREASPTDLREDQGLLGGVGEVDGAIRRRKVAGIA